ncbi:hypothetical protein LDO31_18275 [Luteimonas sp. XNQY3]|nr:hypothetical protein [Luteimonas sp. XNQY3]
MAALALSVAFLPLAIFVAARIYPTLNPPKYRPLAFLLGGMLFLLFGVFAGYALHGNIRSGVIHFSSRYFGVIHADLHGQPWQFWATALGLYTVAVFLAGTGFAGIGLCFGNRRTNEP